MKTGRSVVSSQSLHAKDAIANSTSRPQSHHEAPGSHAQQNPPLRSSITPMIVSLRYNPPCLHIFYSFDPPPWVPSAWPLWARCLSLVYPGPVRRAVGDISFTHSSALDRLLIGHVASLTITQTSCYRMLGCNVTIEDGSQTLASCVNSDRRTTHSGVPSIPSPLHSPRPGQSMSLGVAPPWPTLARPAARTAGM